MVLSVPTDELIGRAIMGWLGFLGGLEFGEYAVCQSLAQFHSPLIEAIDLPNDPLDKDFVFIQGDQAAEGVGIEPVGQQRIRGPIPLKDPMRYQMIFGSIGPDFLGGFSKGQSLGLGQEIGYQSIVMPCKWIVGLGKSDKIARYQFGPLMEELEEGVLAIGTGFTPDDRAGLPRDRLSLLGGAFAVGFHVELLQISDQTGQRLIVREDGMSGGVEKIIIPDAQEGQDRRHVLF